jgi:hypothetical protein
MSTVAETELVPVRSFTTDMEAEIAKSALEAFGIECMISRDDCGGQRPHLAFSEGIRLLVRAEDSEKAEQVLNGAAGITSDMDVPAGL